MKLAKFWSRDTVEYAGEEWSARGWSDESIAGAKAKAREIAHRLAERVVNDLDEQKYPYGERPLPEPTIRQFSGGVAVVTRNLYGVLVLNSDELMFVDIDREDGKPPNIDVERVASRHQLSGRYYQTAAGYRVVLTDRKFVPGSPESEALLKEFGADTMYTRLCRMQASFRARVTPKPWRCEFRRMNAIYPFDTPQAQREYEQWVAEYDRNARPYATCRLLTTFGNAPVLPPFEELIRYHDQESKADSGLPLA